MTEIFPNKGEHVKKASVVVDISHNPVVVAANITGPWKRLYQSQWKRNGTCSHQRKQSSTSGEIICTGCGIILESRVHATQDNLDNDRILANWAERPTLFLSKMLGGKEEDERKVSKTRISSRKTQNELSVFSNVCQKLGLPTFVSEDAWNCYSKLRRELKGKYSGFTRAELAWYAIHESFKIHGHSRVKDELLCSTVTYQFKSEIRKSSLHVLARIKTDRVKNRSFSDLSLKGAEAFGCMRNNNYENETVDSGCVRQTSVKELIKGI